MMFPTTTMMTGMNRMRYETPNEGITLTGYIVRRMHKTSLLQGLDANISGEPMKALAQFGVYAAASATSWGPALYQPRFDSPGANISERDPETGALVTVRQLDRNPHYNFEYEVNLPGGGRINGQEYITGTTFSLRGLAMPAPSQFQYANPDGSYIAAASGTIKSELAPRIGRWMIRGYGDLILSDSVGNRGQLRINRKGVIQARIKAENGQKFECKFNLK